MGEALDRPPLPWDLASAIARAGVDPSLPRTPLRAALRNAIGKRGGYFAIDRDERGWVVACCGRSGRSSGRRSLVQALAWCLVYPMLDELSGTEVAQPP